jgi:prohead serine protease
MNDIIYRAASLSTNDVDVKNRTVKLSFVSRTPVKRFFGNQIIDPSGMREDRFKAGNIPLLLDHRPEDVVGTIISHSIVGDKGYAVAKISRSQRGEDVLNDLADGLRSGVSFGYRSHKLTRIRKADPNVPNDVDDYLVTDFEPLEISLTSVAADPFVGVGRADDEELCYRSAAVTDQDGSAMAVARASDNAQALIDEARRQARAEAMFELQRKESGITIAQLRLIDAFLALPTESRNRIIKSK